MCPQAPIMIIDNIYIKYNIYCTCIVIRIFGYRFPADYLRFSRCIYMVQLKTSVFNEAVYIPTIFKLERPSIRFRYTRVHVSRYIHRNARYTHPLYSTFVRHRVIRGKPPLHSPLPRPSSIGGRRTPLPPHTHKALVEFSMPARSTTANMSRNSEQREI